MRENSPSRRANSANQSRPKQQSHTAGQEDQRLVVQVVSERVGGDKDADESTPCSYLQWNTLHPKGDDTYAGS